MKSIWIAIPAYTGVIHLATMRSLIADIGILNEQGVKVSLVDETGNSMIAHSRDLICAKFLGSDADDLVMIDWDIAWPAGTLAKLVNHPVDLVAGIYPRRADPLGFHVRYIDKPELQADPDTGLLEVEGVPAGFVKISRACLTKMVLAYPKTRFADKYAPSGYGHALFDNIHEGDVYFGEDYSFCRRFRAIEGKVWADPEMTLTHIGNKGFTGSFGEWLRSR